MRAARSEPEAPGGGLRVVHVLGTALFAGTERYVLEVSAELAARGHRVHVVGGEPAAMQRLLPAGVRWSPGATTPRALRSLAAAGRQDVVHSHTSKGDFTALIAAPATGGRRVSTRHILAPRGYDGLARRLAPLVRAALARELAVSAFVAAGVETTPDAVVVNGVRPVADTGARRGSQGPRVLIAQRLEPEKDTATGLRAWAASGLGERGWRLLVAGDGAERAGLEALAGQLGVAGSTDFLGWLPDPAGAYETAQVLLATAPGEPCGLSVIEAMAHGLPVVAAGAGGHVETVGRCRDAALFPPGDAAGAAAHLRRLADDERVREDYGRALQVLQRRELDLAVHVDQLERVYRDAVAARAPLAAVLRPRRSGG